MKRAFSGLFLVIALAFLSGCSQNKQIKVLILSGSNNHEWQNTTPFLEILYFESGLFEVRTSEQPDTLLKEDLSEFDVVVSNWNSWPKNDVRWPAELENALLGFIKDGGGFVTFHASSSAFYKWPEFKNISTAAWVDSTWHGKNSDTEVIISNNKHPITKHLSSFNIFDELWVNAEENESFEILGEATNTDISKNGVVNQPAIFVKNFGKGRVFHTILGHDVETMKNKNFQALMLRGTEWAASGHVKQNLNNNNK